MALWKKVKGYEGLYLVSDEGQIYSLPRKVSNKRGCYVREGQLLKPGLRGNHGLQYEFVILSNGVNSKHESVHRIVATAFVDNPHGYDVVNHIDHNTRNNKASNLEWCTQAENNAYGTHRIRQAATQRYSAPNRKEVVQLSLNGELISRYDSIAFASEATGIPRTTIDNGILHKSIVRGKFRWMYLSDYEKLISMSKNS